jgi:hypothetical protein
MRCNRLVDEQRDQLRLAQPGVPAQPASHTFSLQLPHCHHLRRRCTRRFEGGTPGAAKAPMFPQAVGLAVLGDSEGTTLGACEGITLGACEGDALCASEGDTLGALPSSRREAARAQTSS